MPKTKTLIYYMGSFTFETMEKLLNKLRSAKDFNEMKKPARKRLYSTFVESIDNIFKYAASNTADLNSPKVAPMILVEKMADQYSVTSGNMVLNDDIGDLTFKLDRVNQLDNEALKSLYEDVINKEAGVDDRGAGLGLITMALRTDVDINFSFSPLDETYSYFKMQIIING